MTFAPYQHVCPASSRPEGHVFVIKLMVFMAEVSIVIVQVDKSLFQRAA